MPFLLVIMERQVAAMYEEFFELMHTLFTRDIPADRLYKFEADRRCPGETDIRGRQAVVCGSYCGSGMWKINAYPDV